jgi:Ribbon-helix-helix protein, copG family.
MIRIRKETYEFIKAEAEKRRTSMSQLIDEAIKLYSNAYYQPHQMLTISEVKSILSELESLKRDVEKIKQFLTKKFGMELFALK